MTTEISSTIEWRIYPPPPPAKQDQEKLQKHSKRQPLHYNYQENDEVFMMVTGSSKRHLVPGKVVRVEKTASEEETIVVVAPTETQAESLQTMSTNDASEQHISFDRKDQLRFLQPNMAPKRGTEPATSLIMVQETAPFRQVVQFQLCQAESDRALEIGCSTGELSKRIWKANVQSWVGIDVSTKILDQCEGQLKRFIESNNQQDSVNSYKVLKADPLLEPNKAYQETMDLLQADPTIICVDIGGNREHLPVMEVLSWVFRFFSNPCLRMIIVKSRSLVRAILADDAASIDSSNGMVPDASSWFEKDLKRLQEEERMQNDAQNSTKVKFKHPAKAPLVLSPKDGVTPVCRYHNYHVYGCARLGVCGNDHEHCHACRKPGHRALDCTEEACY